MTDVANGGLRYDLSLLWAQKAPTDNTDQTSLFTGYVGLESMNVTATKTPDSSPNKYASAKGAWLQALQTAKSTEFNNLANFQTNIINAMEWPQWYDVWQFGNL